MTSKSVSLFTVRRTLSSKSLKQEKKLSSSPVQNFQAHTAQTCENEDLPNYVLHDVDHYRQRFNWDCGVSCVLMLLPSDQRKDFLENFSTVCLQEAFGQSTWTVDLCYLLKRFNIKHCMYSTVVGVNEDHKKLNYYDHIMELDRQRVQQRFKEASAHGISIRKGELTNYTIREHLVNHGPVIVLVDNGLLVCNLCKHNKLKSEFRKVFGGSYNGHYILLVGFSHGKFLYHDPGLSRRICAISYSKLDEARTARGTDQDLLLIYKSYR